MFFQAMDHMMVAVARKKTAKAMQEGRDLHKLAFVLASAHVGKKCVADEFVVVAKSKKMVGDMITEVVLDHSATRMCLDCIKHYTRFVYDIRSIKFWSCLPFYSSGKGCSDTAANWQR